MDHYTQAGNKNIGRNQFAAGAALDRDNVNYTQTTDYAYVNPNYTLISVPAWQDGSTMDATAVRRTRRWTCNGHTPNWSIYFTDTLTLEERERDGFRPLQPRYASIISICSIRLPGPGSLDWRLHISALQSRCRDYLEPDLERERIREILPGQPRANFHRTRLRRSGQRPVRLPNALAADPPLQQVVTDTWEAGLRGKPEIPPSSAI